MLQNIGRVLWHLLPLIPLVSGKLFFTVACVLLVALPYIKTMKLKAMIADVESKPSSSEQEKLPQWRKRLGFWQSLTFMNDSTKATS